MFNMFASPENGKPHFFVLNSRLPYFQDHFTFDQIYTFFSKIPVFLNTRFPKNILKIGCGGEYPTV